ncbi:mitogen-activated protein kinase SLT2/MPK1-like [Patiria miniata]|uniref:Protein kinase domain-containing protein n=1 Tax=Patiria miniata TaxID=46514 RepID=A0A914A425_PATMI|nr:mitogen-activated protein kinase SLT2/MPK1-like [Patiria miniata]XP_038058322.1 mitogen-activated protein kinase SLT2/MPK1-like [Patiria miniata]XP_038058332.1 mitogen-activated protein kinase SLT2/MPK1-like [Patiria miniata]XP_038058352.1 mitogen-activated protein kinase SLT2/MPK1-like [Patiria miniata]XP_038058362.1 mitogen-activated protein kinase SLT2/MPK1-like [Patiria miniata]XP_038058371.1 mitogen-activated protein kinase SLT2/MPK1-like [Patiria miniata]
MAKQYRSQSFYVGPRFCDLQPLGFGGGGQVYSAIDVECDKSVAIKKIGLANQKNCKVALREVRILRKLQHENIVKIHDVLYSDGERTNHCEGTTCTCTEAPALYIVQELLDTDLRNIIAGGTLTSEHARLFMYQLLRGMKYLHSANVLHRDLKPDNLLINFEDLVLKIGDFGMARILDPDYSHKGHLTQNVSTRWYRSPELIFCPCDYTEAIDVWSAGCVFAEMLTGKPLFAGEHDLDQMLLILEIIPVSDVDLVEVEDSIPRKMLKNYKGTPRISLCDALPGVEPDALDLLKSLLTFNSNDRASAEEAISHPYLKLYSCASDEPQELEPFHVECEVDNLSPVTLRKIILNVSKTRTEDEDQPLPNSLPLLATNDSEDDYKWKLEMLNFSSRDNSDLDSEEDALEKLDLGKTSFELTPKGVSVPDKRNEKNENEASRKLHVESKENKLLLWEHNASGRDSSSENLEKGTTESDGESSEKLEAEVAETEKDVKGRITNIRFKKVVGVVSSIAESSPIFDKNVLSKTNMENKNGEKQVANEHNLTTDLSEKAVGDKLQKEKQKNFTNRQSIKETEIPSKTEQSVRRKECENKEMHKDHTLQLTNNKVIYNEGKTLQECLEKSGQVEDAQNSNKMHSICQSIDCKGTGIPGGEDSILPLHVASSSNKGVDFQEKSLQPVGLDELLFVEIPKTSSILSAPLCSPPRDGDRSSSTQSPKSKGSNSPREKSVRPKKQHWFYMHKGSIN